MRITSLIITLITVLTACAPDATSPSRNLTLAKPSLDEDGSGGDTSSPGGAGYFCPDIWIKYAVIPGNIAPYHTVKIGSPFKPLSYMQLVGYSATGIPKGKYAVPSGPWVSDDDSIAVVSGNVSG